PRRGQTRRGEQRLNLAKHGDHDGPSNILLPQRTNTLRSATDNRRFPDSPSLTSALYSLFSTLLLSPLPSISFTPAQCWRCVGPGSGSAAGPAGASCPRAGNQNGTAAPPARSAATAAAAPTGTPRAAPRGPSAACPPPPGR